MDVCWPRMLTKQSSLMSRRGRVTSLLIIAASALGFSFGVRARTEIKVWCVVGMHMLKVV